MDLECVHKSPFSIIVAILVSSTKADPLMLMSTGDGFVVGAADNEIICV